MTKTDYREKFINNAISVHGDRYDYSKVEYVNAQTPVTIICPDHGEFEQKPTVHYNLKGGCPACNGGKLSNKENFIKKSRQVHGDRYDYSRVNYVNNVTKVEIICPEHGSFWQLPKTHKRGRGCHKCHRVVSITGDQWI